MSEWHALYIQSLLCELLSLPSESGSWAHLAWKGMLAGMPAGVSAPHPGCLGGCSGCPQWPQCSTGVRWGSPQAQAGRPAACLQPHASPPHFVCLSEAVRSYPCEPLLPLRRPSALNLCQCMLQWPCGLAVSTWPSQGSVFTPYEHKPTQCHLRNARQDVHWHKCACNKWGQSLCRLTKGLQCHVGSPECLPELRQPCGTGRLCPGSATPSTCRSSPSWAAKAAAARLRTDGCAPRSCVGSAPEGAALPAQSSTLATVLHCTPPPLLFTAPECEAS